MKKVFLLLTIVLFTISSVFSYSISEFQAKKSEYKIMIEQKAGDKLDGMSIEKLRGLIPLIDGLILKVDMNLQDDIKLNKLSLLYALSEVVEYKISNYKERIEVVIIGDKRCKNCQTDSLVTQLRAVPGMLDVNIKYKDFSDFGVKEMLEKNALNRLPALILPTNDVSSQIKPYLTLLNDGRYSLNVGSTFDPFKDRSDKGFLIIDKNVLKNIKDNSYIKGNKNAKITWIEYSDIECPFCAKLHNSGTISELEEKYGDNLNIVFQHFPLAFHSNAKSAAEILECVGSQGGSDKFYELIKKSYNSKNSTSYFLINEAVKLGLEEDKIQKCLDDGTFTSKVEKQMYDGTSLFGVTGTPGNVIVNNETGEYELISGAYPTSSFIEVIDGLMK